MFFTKQIHAYYILFQLATANFMPNINIIVIFGYRALRSAMKSTKHPYKHFVLLTFKKKTWSLLFSLTSVVQISLYCGGNIWRIEKKRRDNFGG